MKLTKNKLKNLLKSTVYPWSTPQFCELCGSYSSYKHKGIWCRYCPGKIKDYKEIIWAGFLRKCKSTGSGGINGFFYYIYMELFNDNYDRALDELNRIFKVSKYDSWSTHVEKMANEVLEELAGNKEK